MSSARRLITPFRFLFIIIVHHRHCLFAWCFKFDNTRRIQSVGRSIKRPTVLMSASMNPIQDTAKSGSLLLSNMHKIARTTSPTPSSLNLILASASPRRREILDMMGLSDRYTVQPSPLDEKALQDQLSGEVEPREYARILAEKKAGALCEELMSRQHQENRVDTTLTTLILGSDTIVDFEGHILEKPNDKTDAFDMLNRLSGNWHVVHTGVAVYALIGNETPTQQLMFSFTDTARVKFASLSESDIDSYIQTEEPMDKAGSYGIQGIGGQLVESMEGDFFTVMGLPMHRLSRCLNKAISELGY